MKTLALSCAALSIFQAASFGAPLVVPEGSTVIAGWTFESVVTTNNGTSTSAGPADLGAQPLGSEATAVHLSAATTYSNPAGNGSAKSLSSNNWSTGDYYQFSLNATGYDNIHLIFSQFRSGTGPADFKLSYSNDGATFTDFTGGAYTVLSSPSWNATTFRPETTYSYDLSGITALNGDSSIFFRLVNTSATTAAAGTNRIDDFTVSDGPISFATVPEPSTVITLISGLSFLGLVRRRYSRES